MNFPKKCPVAFQWPEKANSLINNVCSIPSFKEGIENNAKTLMFVNIILVNSF